MNSDKKLQNMNEKSQIISGKFKNRGKYQNNVISDEITNHQWKI